MVGRLLYRAEFLFVTSLVHELDVAEDGTQRSLGAEFASFLTLEMLYVIVFDPPTSVLVSQLAEWHLDGGT